MKDYDPNDIFVLYGVMPIEGFAPGTFLRVERENPSYTDHKGCDGEVTRLKTRDARGFVTFSLLMTSKFNSVFAGYNLANEYTGFGAFPLLIKWKYTDLYFSPEAWIEAPPKVIFSQGIEGREWRIRCKNLIMFPGGIL